ncbi:MAG TPA: hydantoinase/oxoprolinase family protein, partial [Blastocatellia bacterium]|nr:hydantoinase/oxoprolinase family protein [Blastocatellia bacterium]
GAPVPRQTTSEKEQMIRIGVDTGGTFTDFVVSHGTRLHSFKVASTPHNPAAAILEGVSRAIELAGPHISEIVHGTTVATNALLERKGARTALITTEGFEDVIEIGRQARPEIYNFMVTRPAPLVPRERRLGLRERVGPDGSIIVPLDSDNLSEIVERARQLDVESVAVCLLFSFANPKHEQLVERALASLKLPVSLSSKILPEYREYERTSTVVINAYLVPLMSRYLRALERELGSLTRNEGDRSGRLLKRDRGKSVPLRVMQSNGGSVSAETAATEPVRAILSGPAGGVVGALKMCSPAGIRDIITFDMGGTSTDVALCRGAARTTNEALVAGLPVAVPVIDIHTVGAGGGSIARVDDAGALRVGPESAGADPGPACYGRGARVTVTDANLVLGRFGGSGLLGGEMKVDVARAQDALLKLAGEMSRFTDRPVSAIGAALGVVRVANANMERALRVVSVERGQDPRLFTLVSFGGAGGLHVCDLASQLRIPRVVIPPSPGTLSALGVLLGDVVKDYSRTVMLATSNIDIGRVNKQFAALENVAIADLKSEGFEGTALKLTRSVAMRYVGQSFEIDVEWNRRFEKQFHSAHRQRYGYADSSRPTEIVSLRLKATGVTQKPRLSRSNPGRSRAPKPPHTAKVFLTARPLEVPVYSREELRPGMRFVGPAIVTEYSSTTLVPPRARVEIDAWQNVIITGFEGR